MVDLPTASTVVAKTVEISAEVGSLFTSTEIAHRLLQVGIDLNLDKNRHTTELQ